MIKPTIKFKSLRLQTAQTMVEFALVFPIVLLLTYGLIEFGRMLYVYTAVTGAAREGARYGAATAIVTYTDEKGNTHTIQQYAQCAGIRDAVRSRAVLVLIPDSNILISYDKGPGLGSVASTCEALATKINGGSNPIKLGDRVIVHVTTRFTPWIAFLGVKSFNIVSENARTILTKVQIATPYP